jgi:hypothetical protein
MTGPDVYQSVLGIPPGPRPPNYYELLGLELFETDPALIAAAFQRRLAQTEESGPSLADQIRPIAQEICLAKACLLNEKSKADYDRHLNHRILGEGEIGLLEPPTITNSSIGIDHPLADEPLQFEQSPFAELSISAIAAERPRSKKPKSRRLFWIITGIEFLIVIVAVLYMRHNRQADPGPLPPEIVVRPPKSAVPANSPAPQQPPHRAQVVQAPTPRDSFAPLEQLGEPPGPQPPLNDQAAALPLPAGVAKQANPTAPEETSASGGHSIPSEWTLAFPASGDWALDAEMLSLSDDEKKAIAALAQNPVFTVRVTSTKKPIAVLPFDNSGHLNGMLVALLPKNHWHGALAYTGQALDGRSRIFDAKGQCVWFADYRSKGRTKMACLLADGFPVAVQISHGKESDAYLIELNEGKPVALRQQDLSPPQTESLAAALAELAAIENMIREIEKDWKTQLKKWWQEHDNRLKLIAARAINDGVRQQQQSEYLKSLADQQHAGLDKLLSQF